MQKPAQSAIRLTGVALMQQAVVTACRLSELFLEVEAAGGEFLLDPTPIRLWH